jgi:hypothetical protein
MLRRYLVAFVGAVAGGGAAAGFCYAFGLGPEYRAIAACALAVAGFLMVKGESLGRDRQPGLALHRREGAAALKSGR